MKNILKNEDTDTYDIKTTMIIVLLIVILGLIFDSTPRFPSNCHLTPSVDVGGSEVECD